MKWQIIACDLDGTLIGWDHKINERDMDALRRARAAGLHIAICTGRNSRECAGVISALSLDGLGVFVNGAMICDVMQGRAVHSTGIDDTLAEEIVDFFGTRRHATLVLADDPATRMPAYCRTDHAPPHRATTDWLLYNRVHAEEVVAIPRVYAGRVVRLGVVINVDEARPLHDALREEFGARCETHSIYSPHYDCQIIEVFHPGVNKWSGLKHLSTAMNVPEESIVAIGDDINDLAMLRGATLSFAMGSAVEVVKAHAKRVTATHAECGVAKVIDEILASA